MEYIPDTNRIQIEHQQNTTEIQPKNETASTQATHHSKYKQI